MTGLVSIPDVDEESVRSRKQTLLKAYLKNFLVQPFPPERSEALSGFFRRSDMGKVFHLITGNETLLRQVAQCFLLSFNRRLDWFAASSHEFIRMFFSSDSTLLDLIRYDVVIIYHGFDALPNKLTADHVHQIASSRSIRGKRTLILSKEPDPGLDYPADTLESIFAGVPVSAAPASSKQVFAQQPASSKIKSARPPEIM